MGYMCLSCYNEFYKDGLNLQKSEGGSYRCPLVTCGSFNVVEIDDMILPIIKRLNQKGYITEYCCSGHDYEDNTNTYIVFNIDTIPKIIPKGFILEDEEYYKDNNWTFLGNINHMICIRKWYKDIPKNELYSAILQTHLDLMEWVKNLDKVGD